MKIIPFNPDDSRSQEDKLKDFVGHVAETSKRAFGMVSISLSEEGIEIGWAGLSDLEVLYLSENLKEAAMEYIQRAGLRG